MVSAQTFHKKCEKNCRRNCHPDCHPRHDFSQDSPELNRQELTERLKSRVGQSDRVDFEVGIPCLVINQVVELYGRQGR